ncbi:MAG: hypothetical protein ACP5KW_09670 [Thermoproteota archaeon]|jgi:hypothetical protein
MPKDFTKALPEIMTEIEKVAIIQFLKIERYDIKTVDWCKNDWKN